MQKKINIEDLPQRSPIKPASTWKAHNSRPWNVVERVIGSFVGQSWNKAYSHICHKFPWVKEDEGLQYVVRLHCTIENGVPYLPDGRELYLGKFYVVNGILYKRDRRKYVRRKRDRLVKQFDGNYYININEIWYRLEFIDSKLTQYCGKDQYYDCVFGWVDNHFLYNVYGDQRVVAKNKKQIGKKEKKRVEEFLATI